MSKKPDSLLSIAQQMAELPESERAKILAEFDDYQAAALWYDWKFWARPNQIAPDWGWRIWLLLSGRGFGKTRTGAEWVRSQIESGRMRRIALVAATAADARDTMVEGESGILACSPQWFYPKYEPSKRRLTWPNGAIATIFTADEPNRLRGPQHDGAWVDELAAWRYPEAWDMLMMGLRLGVDPQAVVTTTPRPIPLIRDLIKREGKDVAITRGSSYDNKDNLAPAFYDTIINRYEGTRLGRQEIYAEILEDVPGALWTQELLERNRVREEEVPDLVEIVVGVDPSVGTSAESAECGIVVVGRGKDGHLYVLADASIKATPEQWGSRAVRAFWSYSCDRIVPEINNGGDMVRLTIHTVDERVPVDPVRATRGKRTRAEPVSAMYEQGRIHHLGVFSTLEDQMCTWTPDDAVSPDRMDALVWACWALSMEERETEHVVEYEERVDISAY